MLNLLPSTIRKLKMMFGSIMIDIGVIYGGLDIVELSVMSGLVDAV